VLVVAKAVSMETVVKETKTATKTKTVKRRAVLPSLRSFPGVVTSTLNSLPWVNSVTTRWGTGCGAKGFLFATGSVVFTFKFIHFPTLFLVYEEH
jgi:hypothetical protein